MKLGLLTDLSGEGLRCGQVGTAVDVIRRPNKAYEVDKYGCFTRAERDVYGYRQLGWVAFPLTNEAAAYEIACLGE